MSVCRSVVGGHGRMCITTCTFVLGISDDSEDNI